MEKNGIYIIGAGGRMGRKIASLILQNEKLFLAGAIDIHSSRFIGEDIGTISGAGSCGTTISSDIEQLSEKVEALIDFTSALSTMNNLKTYANLKKAVVIGSTGFSADNISDIKELGKIVPVLQSPNMSLGVNMTFKIIEMVSKAVGNIYDIEIIEAHHSKKKDAPKWNCYENC